jgi:hypothetical protein
MSKKNKVLKVVMHLAGIISGLFSGYGYFIENHLTSPEISLLVMCGFPVLGLLWTMMIAYFAERVVNNEATIVIYDLLGILVLSSCWFIMSQTHGAYSMAYDSATKLEMQSRIKQISKVVKVAERRYINTTKIVIPTLDKLISDLDEQIESQSSIALGGAGPIAKRLSSVKSLLIEFVSEYHNDDSFDEYENQSPISSLNSSYNNLLGLLTQKKIPTDEALDKFKNEVNNLHVPLTQINNVLRANKILAQVVIPEILSLKNFLLQIEKTSTGVQKDAAAYSLSVIDPKARYLDNLRETLIKDDDNSLNLDPNIGNIVPSTLLLFRYWKHFTGQFAVSAFMDITPFMFTLIPLVWYIAYVRSSRKRLLIKAKLENIKEKRMRLYEREVKLESQLNHNMQEGGDRNTLVEPPTIISGGGNGNGNGNNENT